MGHKSREGCDIKKRPSLHLLEPSSVTMPRPSALFCLSNAFKSRTLKERNSKVKYKAADVCAEVLFFGGIDNMRVPARLHQS